MLSLKTYAGVIKEIYKSNGVKEAGKATFELLDSSVKEFATSTVGAFTIGTAAAYGMYKAIQTLSDAYNLSYASAIKNTEESFSNFSSTKTEVEDLKSQVDTAKDSLTSMADTYNIEITGTESITELIDKLKSSDLSLEDKAQVSQIEQENASIERQIALKEKLLQYQQKEAASNAMDTMGRGEQSVAQQVAQKVPGGKKTYQGMVNNVNVVDAVKENVSAIQKYENKIADLEKKQASFDPGSKQWKQSEEDINSYNEAIQTLTTDLDSKEGDLTTLLKSFSADGEGTTALSGYEEQFNAIKDALNSINNIDLSPAEQALANLNNYFDGSIGKNKIKQDIEEIIKASSLTVNSFDDIAKSYDKILNLGDSDKNILTNLFGFSEQDIKEYGIQLPETIKNAIVDLQKEISLAQNNGADLSKIVFGNIDLNNRQRLEWTEKNLNKYKDALMSWSDENTAWKDIKSQYEKSFSTVDAGSANFDGVEIAFTPMLQTENGAEYLSKDTVYKYINTLISEATKDGSKWDSSELFALDSKGITIDGKQINGLLADIGDTAIDTAKQMHYLGKDGSVADAFKRIQKAAQESKLTTDSANSVLQSYGLNLEDIGVSNIEDLVSYFNDITEATKRATNSVQDYAASVSDVENATSSENQDKNWSTISEAYKSAKELLKEGKTGTDDFQSVASFLNPKKVKEYADEGGKYTADAYQKAFEDIKKTANRWFGEDETKSMENFVNDFKKKGLFDVKTDDMGLWDITTNFKTTAEAANQFGISVEAVETMLSGLEAYGYDFSKITFSTEGITEYETALNGIKSIYDSLSEGDAKDRLDKLINGYDKDGKHISGWDEEFEKYQDDLDSLSKDQIVKIKFEYDLASIQQKIDELQSTANEGGDTQIWAELNASKRQYREKSEERKGNKIEGVSEYQNVSNTITALQDQMKNATDEQKIQIQEQISGLYDLQNAISDAFADSGLSWKEFIKTDEYKDAIADMVSSSDDAKQVIADLLDIDVEDIVIGVKAEDNASDVINKVSQEEIEDKIVTLTGVDDATPYINLWNMMSADPKFAELSADDQATLVVETYNKLSIDDKNSLISQTGGQATKGVADAVKKSIDSIPLSRTTKFFVSGITSALQKISEYKRKVQSVTGSVQTRAGGGAGQLNGTAHSSGTLDDTSWIKDGWKTKKDEVALTGEEDVEIVANGNKWWTVGDKGAEFSYIPKNSVVFNARQSKQLLKNGRINGRGKALLSGTAYRLGNNSSTSTKKKTTISNKTTSKKSSSKKSSSSSDKVSKKLEKIINSLEKLFDWIEVRVQRLEDRIDLNLAKAENATGYANKNKYITDAQTDTNTLLSTQQKAVAKYTSKANAVAKKVKLSKSLKGKVDDGSIEISKLSDKDKKRVEAYKEWVDKAKEAEQAIEELKQQQKELAQQKLDNIIEQYDTIVNLAESAQKVSETMVDYYTSMGKAVNSNDAKNQIRSQMNQQNIVTSNLQAQYDAYKAELANAAKVFGTSSNEYREAAKKLNDINASLYESKTAYNDLNKQLNELDLSAIQYVIDNLEALGDKMKNIVSLLEKRGANISEADYTKQIANNNSIIEQYYKDRQNRINMIAQNGWEVGSEQYQEYYKAIMKDEDAIYSLLEANEDLKASIVELRWKPFDDLQEKLSNSIDDLDFIRDLLNEDGFFKDNGTITSEGAANIAIIGKAMSTAKQQITDYRKALEKVQDEYDSGNITLEEYNERSRDYIETIKDSVKAVEDYKDSLVEMYKTQMQYQNDALQEYIDKRKEALQKDKEYADYNKRLKSQNKDINSTMAQIRALEGSTNKNSIAELARLKAQLKEQQDELNETVQDHEYEIKISGYDKLSEDAQKAYDDTLKALETNSEKQQEVVNLMLEKIKDSYSSAYGEINNIISNTGLVIGQEAQNALDALKNVSDAISTANSAKENPIDKTANKEVSNINTSKVTTSNDATTEIEKSISGDTASDIKSKTDAENARKAEEARLAEEAARKKTEEDAFKKAIADITSKAIDTSIPKSTLSSSTQKLDSIIKSLPNTNIKKGSKDYNNHSTLWQHIRNKFGKSANESAMKKIASALGIKVSSGLTSSEKNTILKKMRSIGYNKGTRRISKDQLALLDDDKSGNLDLGSEVVVTKYGVLKQMNAGDVVFNNDQVQRLWEMSNGDFGMNRFVNLNTDSMLNHLPEIVNNSRAFNVTNHYDSLLTVNGNVDQETLPKLQVILEKSYQYTTKELAREARKLGMR